MKILIFGSNGQVGQALRTIITKDVIYSTRRDLDLSDRSHIEGYLSRINPDIIINASAYTLVDQAEKEPGLAEAINHHAPAQMSQWVAQNKKKMIHISTDFVFNGLKNAPYCESDLVNPLNTYGTSKWQGEKAVFESGASAVILRTSWVYSELSNNFVSAILNRAKNQEVLKVVSDQIGSPTYAFDLAEAIGQLIHRDDFFKKSAAELYHLCGTKSCSRFEWAKEIVRLAQLNEIPLKVKLVESIRSNELNSDVKRPLNSCLDQTKWVSSGGLVLPNWQFSLEKVIAVIAKNQFGFGASSRVLRQK